MWRGRLVACVLLPADNMSTVAARYKQANILYPMFAVKFCTLLLGSLQLTSAGEGCAILAIHLLVIIMYFD